MKAIISAGRTDCGVTASPEEIAHNPYLLAEMYCGESADDRIPWSTVDRGVLPSAISVVSRWPVWKAMMSGGFAMNCTPKYTLAA
jgi:hypothetical protein